MNFQNSLTSLDFVYFLTAVKLKSTFPLSLFVIVYHYTYETKEGIVFSFFF